MSFIGAEKLALREYRKRIQRFVPDLAVEVVSPSDTFCDLLRKKERYLAAGVQEVWLICPDPQEMIVYRATGNLILKPGATLTSPLLPGFTLVLDDLFQGV